MLTATCQNVLPFKHIFSYEFHMNEGNLTVLRLTKLVLAVCQFTLDRTIIWTVTTAGYDVH